MPILELVVRIDIPDSNMLTHDEIEIEENAYNEMLSAMEKCVLKGYEIVDSEWDYL
jgi:hypothetical protein